MKRLLALLFLLAAVAGCNSSTGDDDDIVSAASYLPLRAGATWTWATIDSAGIPTTYMTRTISGQTTDNGKTYWVSIDTDQGTSYPDSMLLRLDGDILYDRSHSSSVDYTRLAEPQLGKAAFYGDLECPRYKFGIGKNTSWEIYHVTMAHYSSTETGKYLGTETVATPAGEFENCAKFQTTYTWTNSDSTNVYTSHEIEIEWLAPGIGPVKLFRQNQDRQDHGSTFAVTQYSIPE